MRGRVGKAGREMERKAERAGAWMCRVASVGCRPSAAGTGGGAWGGGGEEGREPLF